MIQAMPTRRMAYLALVLLLLTNMMSFVDRTALGVFQEAIKVELELSDWQLGLLGGPAFALLYSVFGIPIARLAERRDRRIILAACIGFWSLMTMLCGAALNYVHLLLARAGVSIGEAGGNPISHSLIGDLFSANERGKAISIYTFGAPLGAFMGAVVAGWLAQNFGWRAAFLWLGPPGFILALAVLFLIPRVRRGQDGRSSQATAEQVDDAPPLRAVVRRFFGSRALSLMAVGASCVVLVGYALSAFLASFLIRRHGLELSEVGLIAGLVNGVAAGIGTLASGFAIDRLGRKDLRFYAWLPGIASLLAAPCFIIGFWTDSLSLSTLLLMLGTVGIFTYLAPTFSHLHSVMEPRMRATAVSIMFLILNIVGLGLGPPLTGLISDVMTRFALDECAQAGATACQSAAGEGITHAMMIVSLFMLLGATLFFLAGRHLKSASD